MVANKRIVGAPEVFPAGSLSDLGLRYNQGMARVSIQQAKTYLSRYIDKVVQGEVVVLCRRNQPVAVETSPARRKRVAGLLKGQAHGEPGTFAAMADEELTEFD